MKQQIVSRCDSSIVLFECEVPEGLESGLAMRHALEQAIAAGANLAGANLTDANLARANLARANLVRANLAGANLARANLAGANLAGANLTDAYLTDANLARANLADANLARANLARANLTDAYLTDANLAGANLARTNLTDAYLAGANLARANLARAKNIPKIAIAQSRILPEGALIGWKKCHDGVIVKLRIPEEARRSHAFGRKCRAEFVDVLEVIGADVGISLHDNKTEYNVGRRITPDRFDENWTEECASGIHFFITREEAENYL